MVTPRTTSTSSSLASNSSSLHLSTFPPPPHLLLPFFAEYCLLTITSHFRRANLVGDSFRLLPPPLLSQRMKLFQEDPMHLQHLIRPSLLEMKFLGCLGVSDDVSSALYHVSRQRPSLVQAACIPQIYSGKDVIIAAETGSGKTHGYFVPLIDNLYNENIRKANGSLNISDSHKTSLIHCPNVMLCEQVVKMASTLCNNSGGPLTKVSSVCGRHVSTPPLPYNYVD